MFFLNICTIHILHAANKHRILSMKSHYNFLLFSKGNVHDSVSSNYREEPHEKAHSKC